MDGMTNKELENLAYFFFDNHFLGVYPCDVIPNTKFKKFSVIFNLSKHNESGSHFISVIGNVKNIIYFDSFGEPCDNPHVLKFMKSFNKPIQMNNKQIQSTRSNFCGLYCLYFLIRCFQKKDTLKNFTRKFRSSKLIENDNLLTKLILREIKNKD